jgi:hypothetical protein
VNDLISTVDHIVYATPDLDATTAQLEKTLGVRAVAGGRHPAWATRNALIALGDRAYLEIFGPDPSQSPPDEPRPFGLDSLTAPRLATWAAKATDLDRLVGQAMRDGIDLGEVLSRSRERPDGVVLKWRMTNSSAPRADGIIPFFIDWGETPHPATTAAKGCSLQALRAEHPDAERVRETTTRLGLPLLVERGAMPSLIATIRCPRGVVELR